MRAQKLYNTLICSFCKLLFLFFVSKFLESTTTTKIKLKKIQFLYIYLQHKLVTLINRPFWQILNKCFYLNFEAQPGKKDALLSERFQSMPLPRNGFHRLLRVKRSVDPIYLESLSRAISAGNKLAVTWFESNQRRSSLVVIRAAGCFMADHVTSPNIWCAQSHFCYLRAAINPASIMPAALSLDDFWMLAGGRWKSASEAANTEAVKYENRFFLYLRTGRGHSLTRGALTKCGLREWLFGEHPTHRRVSTKARRSCVFLCALAWEKIRFFSLASECLQYIKS